MSSQKATEKEYYARFAFWKIKTRCILIWRHTCKHIHLIQRSFFHIYPLLKCHLKSDAQTNKITNSASLSCGKSRMGRYVNISVLQNK